MVWDKKSSFVNNNNKPTEEVTLIVSSSHTKPSTPKHLTMPLLEEGDRKKIAEKLYVMIVTYDHHDELRKWFDTTTNEHDTFKNNIGLLTFLRDLASKYHAYKSVLMLGQLINECNYERKRLLPEYILTNQDDKECIANLLKSKGIQ